MCSMELLKKLSEGAQGPLRADACLAWRQRLLAPPALSHKFLPRLPRQVCTAQSGPEPRQGMVFGPV